MKLNSANIEGKFYLNAFPKAGLHLLDLMVRPIAMPMPYDPTWHTPWAGIYRGSPFVLALQKPNQVTLKLSRVQPGHFLKGHMGYKDFVVDFMFWSGITHYFIYRDLRDVAVSQTYHIMAEEQMVFVHQGRDQFMELGGFDEILEAVIVGLDEYVGIWRRWEEFDPWLYEGWIHAIRFEDAINKPLEVATKMINHFFSRMEELLGIPDRTRQVTDEQVEEIAMEMVATGLRKKISPTFRKGLIGEWRTHFKDHHKDLFKQTDENDKLVELGYEKDKDW